jgi:hypothetical protein
MLSGESIEKRGKDKKGKLWKEIKLKRERKIEKSERTEKTINVFR